MSQLDEKSQQELAEGYALGVLAEDDRNLVERMMQSDAAFSQLVNVQLEKFQVLAEAVPAVEPPAAVWQAVQRDLNIGVAADSTQTKTESIWQSLNFWRGFAVSASLMAIALAVTLNVQTPGAAPGMVYVVQANHQNEWVMQTSVQSGAIEIKALNVPQMGDGEYCQLWAKTADGKMHSLARLPDKGTMQVDGLGRALLSTDTELMITIENQSKSSGQPSNRIVSRGNWVEI